MKKNVLLLTGLEFFRDGYYAGLFILIPFIAKDIHLSLTQAGSLQSFIYVVGLIFSFPMHRLVEKISGMRLLIFCLLSFALTSFGLFFASNFFFLLFCFLFAGIGFCLYGSLAHGLFTKFVDKQERGKLIGNLMAVGDIAKVIAVSSFAFIVLHIGWRLLSVGIGITFTVVFLLYEMMHTSTVKMEEEKNVSEKISLGYILSHKEFLYVLLAGGLDMFANLPLYFLLPFLLFSKGLSAQSVGLVTGTYFFGNMISRLVSGRLVDKFGSVKIFIFSELVMVVMLILLVQASSLFFITLFAIGLGLITEASDPATATMSATIADKLGSFEKVFNVRATVSRVAVLVGPLLLGVIADHTSLAFSFYTIALSVLLAAIPAYLLLKEYPEVN